MKTLALNLVTQSESVLQRQLVSALRYVAKPRVMWTHLPAGGARDYIAGAMLKAEGLHAGWPDLQFVYYGRVYFLELKSRRGTLSESQQAVHAGLRETGAPVEIARSLDEALAILERWGLIQSTTAKRLA
jgi:hypothetical protein